MKKLVALTLLAGILNACIQTEEVDLIIHNATVYTIDESFSIEEAVAVKDGKIVMVGPEHEILNAYSAPEKIDAKKRFLYPGFIDAHSHLLGYGLELQRLNLVGTKSFEDVVTKIQNYIEVNDNKWILGRGWDQNDWENNSFPDNDTLQKLFPDHFIALKRIDGHAYLVSDNVLALAGIDPNTEVDGGRIIRDNTGIPTGVMIDEAMALINAIIPAPDEIVKRHALKTAQDSLVKVGLTSVCDAGLQIDEIALINTMHQNGFKMKVYAMYSASDTVFRSLDQLEIQTDRLTAKSVKVYADGALGSRGASLLTSYSDDTTNVGFMITPADSVKQWAEKCYANGFQLNVHCIGDKANRVALQTMGKVLQSSNDRRWRIEHAQVVHPEDMALFGRYNIIPSMQPTHATSDMPWAIDRLGADRISRAYQLKALLNENGMIALGTDFPVESINPLYTFYAACVRKDFSGNPAQGFQTDQALTREQAIRGMTIWAAIANFEDDVKGSIAPNKSADFVLLDRDLMRCSDNNILQTEVLQTWINGETVFKK